ncbi:glycoside hydrolase family 99-like domain-containing protein [Nisaea sp.]|uniref:glycoside hydrolase family 99-like domain-containing protein n=1 Tax=Nisaea sp. TaxID=2024842 RepID=UPI002B264A7F|nr:glycoside hydrolase family 99-like domain-containing protein [Nisaea sp.]
MNYLARLIAFYLPQYHPVPENDAWWGRGFTEWTNVTRAQPLFPGHYQPHLPADLGFYDLRVSETRQAQADLARAYGIHGFCYYFYSFQGRRFLERPLNEVLESGEPDFPFCICWANETLTRRWDGRDNEVLLQQTHTPAADRAFIEDALPVLRDRRYIRTDGGPILLVYRAALLSEPRETLAHWRRRCEEEGLGRLHISAMETFGLGDPLALGFDSAVEFYPHGARGKDVTGSVPGVPADFSGRIVDYPSVADRAVERALPDYPLFRGLMTSWDNTARRGRDAKIFVDSTPEAYGSWLRAVVSQNGFAESSTAPLVFVNAWNEWAEGAHLEPDQCYGLAYLEATAHALGLPDRGAAQRPHAAGLRHGS